MLLHQFITLSISIRRKNTKIEAGIMKPRIRFNGKPKCKLRNGTTKRILRKVYRTKNVGTITAHRIPSNSGNFVKIKKGKCGFGNFIKILMSRRYRKGSCSSSSFLINATKPTSLNRIENRDT